MEALEGAFVGHLYPGYFGLRPGWARTQQSDIGNMGLQPLLPYRPIHIREQTMPQLVGYRRQYNCPAVFPLT
jgi:hypothetical protein